MNYELKDMKQNIKNIINLLVTLIVVLTFTSCNDEWKDEQYEKYVSFVRSGYNDTYLNTNTANGVVHYKIPIIVSGSTKNDRNINVSVALDPDTLYQHNQSTFFTRQDLYYRQLDEKYYSFPKGMTVTIPAGEEVGILDVDFKVRDLDLVEKYILPLQINSTSEYIPSPKMGYKKTLIRVVPFNYFSGSYSAGAANIYLDDPSRDANPTTVATREMRYVNDSTVFFYAGLCEETARDRATYKIRAKFNSDNTLTLSADSSVIEFTPERATWTIKEEMDVLRPYLLIRTLTIDTYYTYLDITNPSYKVKYYVSGFYTLERRRNTQIPEEDQQEIFDW